MTPSAFIAKWQSNARPEHSSSQEHFIDLCALLGEPTPNSDPTGGDYAFEKGAAKADGRPGWADVWKRGHFAWEYKGKFKDLDAAHRQLLQYAGALGNPPLLVTCDIERIVIRTNFTNEVTVRHDLPLPELADPARLTLLRHVFTDPDRLRPAKTRAALTEEAARKFSDVALRLRGRGHEPLAVAHLMIRLVFCMFAVGVNLLPRGVVDKLLAFSRKRPARFEATVAQLFAAMAEPDGSIGVEEIAWFNGGLFDGAAALPLEADDIALLQQAASLDWADIDPSIMGTLFERGLDPDKRSQLGAHYTAPAMIERIVDPVVRRPLLAEWATARGEIAAQMQRAAAAKPRSHARRDGRAEAERSLRGFLDRLRAFRVLDPACGSGNFLYLSLLALKDIEHDALTEAEALGLQPEFRQVGPEAVLGIEVNPYAAELAGVSVWIGHIQWALSHGYPPPSDPVLRALDTIACRDAILDADGAAARWPRADVIVGNPPFLGGKRLRSVLEDAYCDRLFAAYAGVVPAEADLVCYWFARAQAALAAGDATRAGLVATNSIRGGANRRVLEPVADAQSFREVWSDEPWTLEGAAVRVSLVCWDRERVNQPSLDGLPVAAIHADLSGGGADLTMARRLPQNAGVAFMGDTKGGAFDIPGALARTWLLLPTNANGRPNSDVLRPWVNGMDVTRRPSDTWVVDFNCTRTEVQASFYAKPFAHIADHVRGVRRLNKREAYARDWWKHVEPRPGLLKSVETTDRYIVTPRVAKHRLFVWLTKETLPDCQLIAIARNDDATFGILHSRVHEVWAMRPGTSLEDRPRYTPSTTFERFPSLTASPQTCRPPTTRPPRRLRRRPAPWSNTGTPG